MSCGGQLPDVAPAALALGRTSRGVQTVSLPQAASWQWMHGGVV